jgi:hypothetical protein
LLTQKQVATLSDVDNSFEGYALEKLFSVGTHDLVKSSRKLDRQPTKKDFAMFFQERLATDSKLDFSDIDSETVGSMRKIADFVCKILPEK